MSHSDDAPAPAKPTDIPKAGWFAISKRAARQFKQDNVTDFAAALTYFGILAIFPTILALVSVLGLLGKNQTDNVVKNISAVAPGASPTSSPRSSTRCRARRARQESR